MKRAKVEPNVGQWARFDGYEIRDGCICPKRGLEPVQYDPWTVYREIRDSGEQGDGQAPYVPLLKAVAEVETDEHGQPTRSLRPSEEDEVLAWCRKYGLLGVLLHETLSVTLAPRWDYISRATGQAEPDEHDVHQQRLQLRYVRTNTRWAMSITVVIPRDGSMRRPGRNAPPELILDDRPSFEKPTALILPIGAAQVSVENLAKTWGRYFPDVPPAELNSYCYPCPCTEAFWRLYSEPVTAFVAAAVRLRTAIKSVVRVKAAKGDSPEQGEFGPLLAPVGVAVIPSVNAPMETQWVHGTLLAALTAMAVQDLSANRRLRRCEAAGCSELFVSSAWQARYCSKTCRKRMQMQQYRRGRGKKKRAKAGTAMKGSGGTSTRPSHHEKSG